MNINVTIDKLSLFVLSNIEKQNKVQTYILGIHSKSQEKIRIALQLFYCSNVHVLHIFR